MNRIALIALAAIGAGACTIDGPPEGRQDVLAEMERQERVRQQVEERQRLCRMMNRDSERYERDCTRSGDPD